MTITNLEDKNDKLNREIHLKADRHYKDVNELIEAKDKAQKNNNAILKTDLTNMDFRLQDNMDQRFREIQTSISRETANLKSTFAKMVADLEKAQKFLQENFFDKSTQIKNMTAIYLAKAEDQLDQMKTEIKEMHVVTDRCEALFLNPEKVIEAKLFAIQQESKEAELIREG